MEKPSTHPSPASASPFLNISMFSDASYCHTTRAGGGAYWARTSSLRAMGSFELKGLQASHEAEVAAACKGILALTENPAFRQEMAKGRTTLLVLVVDCLAVKQVLEGQPTSLSQPCLDLVHSVQRQHQELGFKLKINHVKAHKGVKQPRQWVNDWCDREAKEKMRWARKVAELAQFRQKAAAQRRAEAMA